MSSPYNNQDTEYVEGLCARIGCVEPIGDSKWFCDDHQNEPDNADQEEAEAVVYKIWAIVKEDSLASSKIGSPSYQNTVRKIAQLLLEDKTRSVDENEIEALGHIIPNFDGVGGIGYQYDDGSRVSVETRIEQLEASLKERTDGKQS